MNDNDLQKLHEELKRLEADLADREAALPAHSVRPHQIVEIEEIEDKIAELKTRLGSPTGKA